MPEADLRGARLDGARMPEADLRGARGLTVEQLVTARIYRSTLLDNRLADNAQVRRRIECCELEPKEQSESGHIRRVS